MPLEVSNWNEERVEKLKDLWAKGLSCSVIAHKIGGTTRNAVIGKVARLGLPGRQITQRAEYKRKHRAEDERRVGKAQRKTRVVLLPLPTTPLPDPDQFDRDRLASSVTLLDLEPHHCRYPVGSTDLSNHRFCGLPAHTGLPYCGHHARVAFQPAAVKEIREMRPRGHLGRVVIGEVIKISNVTEFLEPA